MSFTRALIYDHSALRIIPIVHIQLQGHIKDVMYENINHYNSFFNYILFYLQSDE